MIELLLENRANPSFQTIAKNPRNTLFKLKQLNLKVHMDPDFLAIEPFEISLQFKTTIVKTTLKELLEADDWNNLADFHEKIKNKKNTMFSN